MTEKEFIKAYDAYADAIFRYCYFRLYDRERAQEIMQESFMKTWAYTKKREARAIENLRAFLYRVARNLVINESKKPRHLSLDRLLEAGLPIAAPDTQIVNNLDFKRLLTLTVQLDVKYREPLLLRFVEGLGPKEIAKLLGISQNAVSVRINRGIQMLKKIALRNYEKSV